MPAAVMAAVLAGGRDAAFERLVRARRAALDARLETQVWSLPARLPAR